MWKDFEGIAIGTPLQASKLNTDCPYRAIQSSWDCRSLISTVSWTQLPSHILPFRQEFDFDIELLLLSFLTQCIVIEDSTARTNNQML